MAVTKATSVSNWTTTGDIIHLDFGDKEGVDFRERRGVEVADMKMLQVVLIKR